MAETDIVRGRLIVVTGGGHGIGAALAREAARRGAAAVAVLDIDGEAAATVAREIMDAFDRLREIDTASYDVDEIVRGMLAERGGS